MSWVKRLKGKVSQLKKDTAKKKQYLKYYKSAKPGSRMTYGQWLDKKRIRTVRTKDVERGLGQAGLSKEEIRRLRDKR